MQTDDALHARPRSRYREMHNICLTFYIELRVQNFQSLHIFEYIALKIYDEEFIQALNNGNAYSVKRII
jgi:hypothetical protein